MTFELAISREAREDGDDSRKRKKTKNLEFIMKSPGRMQCHQESQALCTWSTVIGSWSSIIEVELFHIYFALIKTVRQHLYGHEGQ